MSLKVYIDGKLYDKENAKISVFDHGFLYGDGVFEGIRVYNNLIFKLNEHIERLYDSAKAIMLKMPLTEEKLTGEIIKTLQANKLSNAYIRVVATRGIGDLGLSPLKCKTVSVIIITDNIALYPEKYYKDGLSIITVPTRRNVPEALNPKIKSLNYLNNILAKIEAINSGFEEAIMLNAEGYIAECTGDNIFMVKNGELFTTPGAEGSLEGITKDTVAKIAKQEKIQFAEKRLTRYDLFVSDEVFLTGTAAEIIPVVKVDGRVIGSGKPGNITLKLIRKFHEITKKDGIRYKL